jgi:hypothetical protein
MHIHPVHLLETAEQATRLGEITLAKKYVDLALTHPETAVGAKKLLKRIERKSRILQRTSNKN